MLMINPTPAKRTVIRGDVLRVTATTDSRHRKHIGENYWLERVMAGRDRDLVGNEVGPMRHYFNLVNTTTGKARITDSKRLFVTQADGVTQGIALHELEQHFQMRFKHITDERTIAPKVNDAVQAEAVKNDSVSTLVGLLLAALGAGSVMMQDDKRFNVRPVINIGG